MNILITGVAGFIGFNLAKCLLNKNYKVYGIDNFDPYYSILLKKKRLNNLKNNKQFIFKQLDLTDKKKLNIFFKNKKFDLIINLAAQAGVRYSLINPTKYIDTNIFSFLNLIELANKHQIKKIMYASSSSVYGENTNFPLKENEVMKLAQAELGRANHAKDRYVQVYAENMQAWQEHKLQYAMTHVCLYRIVIDLTDERIKVAESVLGRNISGSSPSL